MNPISKSFFGGSITGVAMERARLKEKMAKAAKLCGMTLLHYHQSTKNKEQENKLKDLLKDLLYLRKRESEIVCEEIYDEVKSNFQELIIYGCSAEDLTELGMSIEAYKGLHQQQEQVKKDQREIIKMMQEQEGNERKAA